MRLLRREANPTEFEGLLKPLLMRSVGPLSWSQEARGYYHAILGDAEAEPSFLIEDGGRAIMALVADMRGGHIGRFGQPAGLLEASDAPLSLRARATTETIGELAGIIRSHQPASVRLITPSRPDRPETLAFSLLSAGYVAEPLFTAVVDLSQDRDAIERGFRKGHRAQLKWGRGHLALRVMDSANPDPAMMDAYRVLHAEVAGRVTRPIESWHAAQDMVSQGHGRLILSELEGKLVGGTLIMDGADTAHYASAAYRRELFDKPLGHWPLLRAMELSKAAGRKRFDIGDVTLRPTDDEKLHNIAKFKRGFTSTLVTTLSWTLARGETNHGS